MIPFQPPLLLFDDVAQHIERTLRRMRYDDVLMAHRRGWRLEYVRLAYGLAHYRLYRGKQLVGILDVSTPRKLPTIHRDLAAYLAGMGFTPKNLRLVVAGSRTPLDAPKHRVPALITAYSKQHYKSQFKPC